MKFATKLQNSHNNTHLTLGMLLHYLGKLKIQIFCRYSADIEEDANKLHFKKLPTFKIRLVTSLLCTLQIQTSCQTLVVVAEYHVDC